MRRKKQVTYANKLCCSFLLSFSLFPPKKLANRQKVFAKSPPTTWSTTRKTRIKQILDMGLDYISSEESGDDNIILYRRPLQWMKSKYSNSMKVLDKLHYKSLSTKSKAMFRKREVGEPSERPVPSQPLQFAIKSNSESLDVSTDFETSGDI